MTPNPRTWPFFKMAAVFHIKLQIRAYFDSQMTNNVDFCDKAYVSGSNISKYDENKILTASNMAKIQYGRHFSLEYPKSNMKKKCVKKKLSMYWSDIFTLYCMHVCREMPAGFQDPA